MNSAQNRKSITEDMHLEAEAAISVFSYKTPEKIMNAKIFDK